MHLQFKHLCNLRVLLFLAITSLCFVSNISAQRTSEKHITLLSNFTTLVDQYTDNEILNVQLLGVQNLEFEIDIDPIAGDFNVSVISTSPIVGERTFTIEYTTQGNPDPVKNYRVYYLTFANSIVKANDDIVLWDGTSPLTIDVLANDVKNNVASLVVNQKSSSATISTAGNQISYNNSNFTDFDYIHYTIIDSTGTSDQAIVKIELTQTVPTENESYNFIVNYLSTKNISVPEGFTLDVDPFNGSIETLDAEHYVYTPAEYFIGQDSFVFRNDDDVTITYFASIIDAERDPGIVKNDVYYTPKGQAITFDVFDNDMTDIFEVTAYSSTLTHDTLGVFTYTPSANTTGQKNFFYKINNGSAIETGTINIHVGNQHPMEDILYEYDVLAGKDFVIEYDVPISGYSFTIAPGQGPSYGNAYCYVDSTDALACGTAYGRAMIVYSAPSAGAVDTMTVKYWINQQYKSYKLIFNSYAPVDPACNCIDDCVWSGDLNGDGRVSGRDLMVLGRYFGYNGSDRDVNNETIWIGDNGTDWGTKAVNGKDLKHADSNGDGILNEDDMQAIVDNFGKLNSLVPTEQLAYKDFQLTLVPDQTEYEIGDTATIYIYLGTENKPANGIHGLSFGIDMDGIDSFYHDINFYNNTWLSDHSPILQMYKQVSYGQLRTAVTRTSGKGSSGFGLIGQMSIIIEEVDGVRQEEFLSSYTQKIIVDGIEYEDGSGQHYLLEPSQFSLTVYPKEETESNTTKDGVTVSPNPGENVFFIISNKNDNINQVSLYNSLGHIILQQNSIQSFEHQLDISTLPSGVYYMRVSTDSGVVVKTVVKK